MNMRSEAEKFTSARLGEPESLPLLVLIAAGAVWATRAQILPGQRFPVIGAGFGGLLWACLFLGLGLAFCAAAVEVGRSPRGAWRKLGLCLALAFVATYGSKLLVLALLGPATWSKLFYLRFLLPPAFVALWCAVLLPRESRALVRAARTNPSLVPLPQLVLLAVAATVLVSGADLAFELMGRSAVETALRGEVVGKNAWVTNILLLFSLYALILAVTARSAIALILISPAYAALVVAGLVKIKYLHSAVQPLDLIRLPEFLPLFRPFFGTRALVAVVVALGLWIGALVMARKLQPCRMSVWRRRATGVLSLTILLGLTLALIATTGASPNRALRLLGAPGWEFQEHARQSGFLLSFLTEIRKGFVSAPANYSPGAVERALHKYWSAGSEPQTRPRVNLIVYLVESLMDPEDLGLHYTSDPIPILRGVRKSFPGGYGIVPEEFGGSANTEFEALTGMATCFLPRWSLPYRQYLLHPIPSLPEFLRHLGYATTAVQADPRYYFDRERAYKLLGFSDVVWLDEVPGIERAPRGIWPSDKTVVDAVIGASQRAQPFFIFAFPSSTHSPYNSGIYRNSELDMIEPSVSDSAGEVKEYINALRAADRDIGILIDHFRHQRDSTIIVILGDHLPPLSDNAYQPFFTRLSKMPQADQSRTRRRVPLAVWANFELGKGNEEFSINALPGYLLKKMKLAPPPLLAVAGAVQRQLPVLPSDLRGCGLDPDERNDLSPEQRELLSDYRLLEYDLLLGKQYSRGDADRP